MSHGWRILLHPFTLMKGDEIVEAIEQDTDLGLFFGARHAYLTEKQLVEEEVESNAALLQGFYLP